MNNSFVQQFSSNIKFKYSCFDRVILRGYILWLFFPAGVVHFLRAMGFKKLSNGVMRLLTDPPDSPEHEPDRIIDSHDNHERPIFSKLVLTSAMAGRSIECPYPEGSTGKEYSHSLVPARIA